MDGETIFLIQKVKADQLEINKEGEIGGTSGVSSHK